MLSIIVTTSFELGGKYKWEVNPESCFETVSHIHRRHRTRLHWDLLVDRCKKHPHYRQRKTSSMNRHRRLVTIAKPNVVTQPMPTDFTTAPPGY